MKLVELINKVKNLDPNTEIFVEYESEEGDIISPLSDISILENDGIYGLNKNYKGKVMILFPEE